MTKQIMREIDWYEGVFLRPHHFQYQDDRIKSQYRNLREALCPYFWGVDRVLMNEQSIAAGVISARSLSFRTYEGVDIEVGRNAVLESRNIQNHLSEIDTVSLLYVGVRKIKPDFDNMLDVQDSSKLSLFERPRFVRQNNVESVYDLSVKNSREDIGFLTYNLQYFLPFELDQAGEFDLIPIARIRKINSRVVLDSSYVPPAYNVYSHAQLEKLLNESVNDCAVFVDNNSLRNVKENSDHVDVLRRQLICQALVSYISSINLQKIRKITSPYYLWSELKTLSYALSSYSDSKKLVDLLSVGGSGVDYSHFNIVESISGLLNEIRSLIKELDGK
ncbi:MAG: type VI secretion system baseplate subunit TssK, partial [Gammaproteobacteria bacterium]|nr:type VI secretion system baseplate subunit TssK [Gammaproteobacteria bacterium]